MVEQQDLFARLLPPRPALKHVERLQQVQEGLPEWLYLGTTSWTHEDWEGLVYPSGCPPQDYLEQYARVFRMVEVDTTWYRIPSRSAVEGWLRRTPDSFRFAAKVPRVISHEKELVDCREEMEAFLEAVRPLGPRLGVLLLQFGYVARGRDAQEHETGARFIDRLDAFLRQVQVGDFRLAVEVRNARWLRQELVDLLRSHRVALVLNNYYTMPDIDETLRQIDPVTADFLYVRFLGDRRRMDEHVAGLIAAGDKQRRWNELLWDRRAETGRWVAQLKKLAHRRAVGEVYVLFNNHYAGYAPGSLGLFARAWKEGSG